MIFSSLLFVFLFLTLNLLSQIIIRNPDKKNLAMLGFSLVFYLWFGPKYLILVLAAGLIAWFSANIIEGNRRGSKIVLIISIVLLLGLLLVFRYGGLFLDILKDEPGDFAKEIVVPVGISVYTLLLISYVVDVYRGDVQADRRLWVILLYGSIFHLAAGPIARFRDIEDDLEFREITLEDISGGISRFSIGLAKSVILAKGCGIVADSLLIGDATQLKAIPIMGILLGAFAFSLQIYLSFSAYSDMAIGMGMMCGIHYAENFDYPYIARTARGFWSRWYMTLRDFFTDYVFLPLGGEKRGEIRTIINTFIVCILSGIWYGVGFNYIIWGALLGLVICLEEFWLRDRLDSLKPGVRRIITLLIVMIGWMIFKFSSPALAFSAIRGLVGLNFNGISNQAIWLLFKNNFILLVISVIAATPAVLIVKEWILKRYHRSPVLYWAYSVWDIAHPVILLILSAMALVGA